MDFFREFSLNLLEYSVLMVITFDIKPSDVLFLEKQIHSINMDYEEMYFFIIFFSKNIINIIFLRNMRVFILGISPGNRLFVLCNLDDLTNQMSINLCRDAEIFLRRHVSAVDSQLSFHIVYIRLGKCVLDIWKFSSILA